ncbi:methyltransferase domain-containing protein [Bdellovibrio sp. HCB209]|uniref:methyltransferase domain-containing protein n=1 Tax=Bdellovibrio sp. HCB209 TaxID=3394354 RepID=UPI0039B6A979
MLKKIDIGCGPNKSSQYYGVDQYPFPGVDQVFDLNSANWPLPESHFLEIKASHIIEHVKDTQNFLKEIHRISANNAEVIIETPHFSWIDSWNDPTHLWHFSSGWYRRLLKGEYLSFVVGEFELIESRIEFNQSLRSLIPRLLAKVLGQESYEKHYAFIFPARNIHTRLKVIK